MHKNLQNSELEKAIVSGLAQHGDSAIAEIDDIITSKDFFHVINQKLYTIIKHLTHEQQTEIFDLSTLKIAAGNLGFTEFSDHKHKASQYLESLFESSVQIKNLRQNAFGLKRLSFARQVDAELNNCIVDIGKVNADTKFSEIMGIIEKKLFSLSSFLSGEGEIQSIGHEIDQHVETLIANQGKTIAGTPTGFQRWDKAIGGGLRKGTINIVGARPKTGKSYLAINMAHNINEVGIPVLYLDTELTKSLQQDRHLALLSQVDREIIEVGAFTKDEETHKKVSDAIVKAQKSFDYMSVGCKDLSEILSLIRRWLVTRVGFDSNGKAKDCVVIYDFIKINNSDTSWFQTNEYQALGNMMTQLVNFATQYDVPFLVMTQLNRDAIEKKTGQGLVAGSDRIEWFCSTLSIMGPKTSEDYTNDPHENGRLKLSVVMTRFGRGLKYGDYINVKADFPRSKMTEGITYGEAHSPLT